ncbi:MAG: hemolysin family protein [Thermoanaerobaculia bacterium]|nr:hemolysin family protein [Thermoanaerobaculia bacterium]
MDSDVPVLPLGMAIALTAFVALATVVLAVVSALLERSGHIRLRHWTENANAGLRELWERPSRFLAYRFVLSLLARSLPLALLALLWSLSRHPSLASNLPLGRWMAPTIVVVLLLSAEWLNRYLVERDSEAALESLTPVYRVLHFLISPLLFLVAPLVGFVDGDEEEDEDEDEASEDEIDAYIDVGRREGILEPEEEELVRSVVDFGDTQVRSIMTPRVEINSASVEASLEDLALKFFESKNSRLPLFRDSIDHVVGVLHIRDLFEAVHRGTEDSPADLCQQPLYVPESKPLPILLQELQERHQQMAIVVDEYGGVAGLVTVEDLVEEIVGDIRDEHEARDVQESLGDGRWRLAGRIYLEDLRKLMELDLDFDDLPYETVSGLICGEAGAVPAAGETVYHHGLSFTVEEADERRVTQVVVARAEPGERPEATGGSDAASSDQSSAEGPQADPSVENQPVV